MLESVPIKNLKLLDNNPRRITEPQFKKLCKSLIEDPKFLECRPILVNRAQGELIVYAGNQRVRAAKKLKWKSILCEIEDNLSEEVMNSRILKDNVHYGEFDMDMLNACYDIEMMLDSGFTEEQLTGDYTDLTAEAIQDLGVSDEGSDDEVLEKKKKMCPNCGHEF